MNLADVKATEAFFGLHARPARQRVENNPMVRAWHTAKRITLIVLLAGSFMFYYVLDMMNQAYSAF